MLHSHPVRRRTRLPCGIITVIFTVHVTDISVCIMYLYLINVCIINLLYFEYGPSLSSVVGLK